VRKPRKFGISIRAGLGIGVVAAVLLTAAIVHVPWSLTSRANITDLNQRLNALVIHSIAEKIDGLLDNAVAARQALGLNLSKGVIDIDDRAKRQFLFLSFLESQPSLTAVEFGWPDDRSFLVLRAPDNKIRVEETTPASPEPLRRTDIYGLGESGEPVFERSLSDATDYKATQLLWYLTAFDKDAPLWSNIYGMPARGGLVVTTSAAIAREGTVIGVLAVSISLARLSEFLDGIEVSPHGAVFLTNVYDELVAVQRRMGEAAKETGEQRAVAKLEDVPLTPVRVTVAALKANGVDLESFDRNRQFVYRDAGSGENYFVTLAPLAQMGLVAAVVIPESDVLGDINRNTERLIAILAGFVVVVGLGAALLAWRSIGRPLGQVTANLKELESFRLDRIKAIPSSFSEIAQVSAATMRMSASLASFQKYIPTELVRTLFARGIEAELGGERRELTILFMDLANFTHIAEELGDGLVAFLGNYLSEMSTRIQEGGGTIDKYMGDAIMAFWGAPVPSAEHALEACRAALACQACLARLDRESLGRGMPQIRARIGVNTGRVLVGNVGSRERLNYTVIGDPVNVASRLEHLNKTYGTEIIIGQNTYEAAREHILVRPLDRVAVYGREMGLEMYELLAMKGDAAAAMTGWIAVYEEGRTALRARDWDRAIALFRRVIALRGGCDSVSALQIARAQAFKTSPPPADWDGLVVMESK